MTDPITEAQWQQYEEQGYLYLGKLLNDDDLAALLQRIDDIMLGKATLEYDRVLMQLDSTTGRPMDLGPQTRGHKGATLNYRKIQDLELDPLFRAYMERPIFREICELVYGPTTPVASFRAMFMNKPAGRGTFLQWHQDRWKFLDRDPLVTVWTALDPATEASGAVEIIPGSHKFGLVNPEHGSGFLTDEQAADMVPKHETMFIEVPAGEAVLLHNWVIHSSDTNHTNNPRRAFSVCYMDARTQAANGETFPLIFPRA